MSKLPISDGVNHLSLEKGHNSYEEIAFLLQGDAYLKAGNALFRSNRYRAVNILGNVPIMQNGASISR